MLQSGCQVSVVKMEGIGMAGRVKALRGDGKALIKEGCFTGVTSDRGDAKTDIRAALMGRIVSKANGKNYYYCKCL